MLRPILVPFFIPRTLLLPQHTSTPSPPNHTSHPVRTTFPPIPPLHILALRFYAGKQQPNDRRYTKSHEWIKIEGQSKGRIGITAHASEALGDIVFVELPEVGARFAKGDSFAAVESVKAASDIYTPIAGTIEEINSEIENSPNLVNESPFDKGWLTKISIEDESQLDGLLTHEQYAKWLEDEKK